VRGPVTEVRAFLRAALVTPVPGQQPDPPGSRRRRLVVAALTLVAGSAVLATTLRIDAGDDRFYSAALALAGVWILGAVLSGPLHLGWGHTRGGGRSRPVVQSLALGGLAAAVFLAGALVVARAPLLRQPVDELLDHARFGSLPAVVGITVINGVAEEAYFRGALFAALPPRRAVAATTVLYAATTLASGVPLLVLAAVVLGLLTGLQRRVTGGFLGPAITHVTWSTAMLVLLPPVLDLAR
jgi:membrane protease YdiL (CAAX protease family)